MRFTRLTAVPVSAVLATSLLAGCGGGDSKDAASSAGAAATSAGSAATSGASSAGADATSTSTSTSSAQPIDCPTENTRSFAKTRFAADLGLAAGTFHRWIYKPYQAGSFKKGQVDKTDAVKAAAVAAIDYKLLKNASENAKANPTLCKKVAQPLSDAMAQLKNIDTKQLLLGNVAGLGTAQSALSSVLSGSKETGNQVTEMDDLSKAKQAAGN